MGSVTNLCGMTPTFEDKKFKTNFSNVRMFKCYNFHLHVHVYTLVVGASSLDLLAEIGPAYLSHALFQ